MFKIVNTESAINYIKSNISFISILISSIFTAFFLSSLVINYEKITFIHPIESNSYIKNNSLNEIKEQDLSAKYMENISDIMRYSLAKENSLPNNNENDVDIIVTDTDNKDNTKEINIADISVTAIILSDFHSMAVFKTNSPEDTIVYEGDTIGKFKVQHIMKNKVILVDSKGKTFEKQMLFGAKVEPEKKDDNDQTAKSTDISLSKREFLSLFDPPDKLMKDLILSPFSKNNRPYGIRITTLNPESIMSSKVGLRPGDVLLKINNKQLTTPEEAMIAYSTIKNENEIVFKIDRDGKVFDLKVTLI